MDTWRIFRLTDQIYFDWLKGCPWSFGQSVLKLFLRSMYPKSGGWWSKRHSSLFLTDKGMPFPRTCSALIRSCTIQKHRFFFLQDNFLFVDKYMQGTWINFIINSLRFIQSGDGKYIFFKRQELFFLNHVFFHLWWWPCCILISFGIQNM